MKHRTIFDALAQFDLVARHGGFSRAEAASGKSKATLSRQVRALEEQLGLRLIDRDSRAFSLTAEGRALHERTSDLLCDLTEAMADLTHDHTPARGRLRVSCPMMYGHMMMGRHASDFVRAYPDIQLEIAVEDREVDLIEEGFDVVIRVNPRPDSQLVGRCILSNTQHLVAAPDLACPEDTSTPVPAVTRFSAPDDQMVRVLAKDIERTVHLHSVVRLSSPMMIYDAVRAGGLAAVLPYSLIAEDVNQGRLVDWGQLPKPPVEIWALHTSRRLTSARIRAFVDFLAATTTTSVEAQHLDR